MTCDSCAKMIELDLEDAGHSCRCSYQKGTLEIETEHQSKELMKSNIKNVIEIVKSSGYTLEIIK